MSEWKFVAELEELELVCNLLAYVPPMETQGEGVWVRSVNGGRVWSVATDITIWEVHGDPVEFPIETRCLPSRAIWEARILALSSNNHEVEFSIPDDLVCLVTTDIGSTVIDLPRETEVPTYPMYVVESASATTTIGALFDLLFRARMVPLGPSNEEYPDAQLFIENNEISIFVDWSLRNASRSTHRIPAQVNGEANCSLLMGAIYDVIREMDRDKEVTLRIPARPDIPVLIESGLFRAAVKCTSTGAVRLHDELHKTLSSMSGCQVRAVDSGKFVVATRTREFTVELTDRPDETVSVHSEVCRDMPVTFELLSQINETNAALVGSRLWMVDEVVWAGLDLPASAMGELERALRALDHQLTGFDVFLSGFSAA
jgi:hypothetical protein